MADVLIFDGTIMSNEKLKYDSNIVAPAMNEKLMAFILWQSLGNEPGIITDPDKNIM